ncbi:MAG TPA: hypothetical protein DDY31_09110 [Lachnospiraceae bacterium]|nr:hypothetical protein [Lachnospiraceae bacterium]
MTINGISGVNTQAAQIGMNQSMDSYSKNIQNQIANAQKQLQELSSNEEMTLEEKMKKRQEIQQQISDLNMQLRQHQMEQRKEKQQAKSSSMDEMLGGTSTKGSGKSTGLSQASMTAMISADTSMKQAKVQGSVATEMKCRANVLKAEIKQSGSTEAKEAELADLEQKAVNATAAQMNTLVKANKAVEETATTERTEKKASDAKEKKEAQAEGKTEKTADSDAKGEKAQDGISGADVQTGNIENVQKDNGAQAQNIQPVEIAIPETPVAQAAVYTHVDVCL